MSLTILNVAYPLAPVSAGAVGGAEQIVHMLDRSLVAAGHRSIVLACDGSRAAGELVRLPPPPARVDTRAHTMATAQCRAAIERVLARTPVDLVHLHGHDFDMYLPAAGPPALATLHLPPELLIANVTQLRRPDTWVHGVSWSQHARLPRLPFLLPPIENGVELGDFPHPRRRRRGFAAILSRVCPEKGIHLALDAAAGANVPVIVAGATFPYDDHRRYFEREVLPRLGRTRRYIGPVGPVAKRHLLAAAACLLVPSLVEETSSLAAMEAMACGTPVLAFARGALRDIVVHGVTGFLVRNVAEMTQALRHVGQIDGEACRAFARARFSATRMVDRYLERYAALTCSHTTPASPPIAAASNG